MTAELRDFRLRITPETDAMLEAISRATATDKQDTARDVLHKWAVEQLHVATLAMRLAPRDGSGGSDSA